MNLSFYSVFFVSLTSQTSFTSQVTSTHSHPLLTDGSEFLSVVHQYQLTLSRPFTHHWCSSRSNLGLSVLPKDTSLCDSCNLPITNREHWYQHPNSNQPNPDHLKADRGASCHPETLEHWTLGWEPGRVNGLGEDIFESLCGILISYFKIPHQNSLWSLCFWTCFIWDLWIILSLLFVCFKNQF